MNPSISQNFDAIQARISAACQRSCRSSDSVQLIAVSKTYGPSAVRAAVAAGQLLFGENRVQEAAAKIPECPSGISWHMIGHLQSNKAASVARLFDWVHSVDSAALLSRLDTEAQAAGRHLKVLLQVNVSGERAKSGLAPEAVPAVLEQAQMLSRIQLVGLMTIPPLAPDPETMRPFFRRLRELRDTWTRDTGFELLELSMGMTHDLEVAIEEGATFVRVGTGLFGERPKPEQGTEET